VFAVLLIGLIAVLATRTTRGLRRPRT
jgi:hypothetical protein